uniref:Band 7 domain-containing protein n=1 Tax=Junco hyemalis TaxID=40217 RepID=A0A8C5NIG4_JUNHY
MEDYKMPTVAIVIISFFAVIVFIVLIILLCSLKIVNQTDKYVIERLGKYLCTWDTGIHFLAPFVDRIQKKVSMKEQIYDFPPQPVITKDNVTMQIDTVVFFNVTDPKLFTYGVENPIAGIEALSATTLRNIIGDLDLDQTLTTFLFYLFFSFSSNSLRLLSFFFFLRKRTNKTIASTIKTTSRTIEVFLTFVANCSDQNPSRCSQVLLTKTVLPTTIKYPETTQRTKLTIDKIK